MIKEFPNIAIIAGNREIDYGQMLQKVSLFARFTPQGKHTRTLLFSENREGWIYAFFAIWAQGGIAVPVDAGSTPHDVAYILNDSNP
ncbi:MAG: AMP-binding protein, partial [Prevotellaceae bacterium]|nr:AMP-binding protein [Prevotellaceae bacterium]